MGYEIYILFGVLLLGILIFSGIIPLGKKQDRVYPEMMTEWIGLHPDGTTSSIEYYRTGADGCRLFKFRGNEVEVRANPKVDYVEDERARSNMGYFRFRINQNGTFAPWEDFGLRWYFEKQHSILDTKVVNDAKNNYMGSLKLQSSRSIQKIVADTQEEDYIESIRTVEIEKAKAKQKEDVKIKTEVSADAEGEAEEY